MKNYNSVELINGVECLKLQFTARVILSKLINLVDENNEIIISQSDLMKLANCALPTITRSLRQLKAHDFVSVRNSGQAIRFGRAPLVYTVKPHQIMLAIEEREKYMNLDRDFAAA